MLQPLSRETRNLLCTPMVDSSSARIGCILAVNKKRVRLPLLKQRHQKRHGAIILDQ